MNARHLVNRNIIAKRYVEQIPRSRIFYSPKLKLRCTPKKACPPDDGHTEAENCLAILIRKTAT
jgi:hypothetical protein